MYVYVDLFLGLNFFINAGLLFLTAKLCQTPIRWLRICMAAAAGAMYALGALCLDSALLYTITAKLIASLVLIRIAFSARSLKSLMQLTAAYYIASFAAGGAVAGWCYYRQPFVNSIAQPISRLLGWEDLVGGAMLSVGLLLFVKAGYFAQRIRRTVEYDVEVIYQGNKVMCKAILDTGNALYSISRKPVIIVDYDVLRGLLSTAVSSLLAKYPSQEWLENIHFCEDKEWLARMQVIPFRALGGNNVIIGFRPDTVRVYSPDTAIETTDVIIGIYAGNLSLEKRYRALLHPAILHLCAHKEVKTCITLG